MTLCELEAIGIFGWPDIAMALFSAFLLGSMVTWWLREKLERQTLLAVMQLYRARTGTKPGDPL